MMYKCGLAYILHFSACNDMGLKSLSEFRAMGGDTMHKKRYANAAFKKNRRGLAYGLLFAAVLSAGAGCSPKTYLSTYAADGFDPQEIKTVTLVVDDVRVNKQHNLLFAETFLNTALEKKSLPLARNRYVLKENLPKAEAAPAGPP